MLLKQLDSVIWHTVRWIFNEIFTGESCESTNAVKRCETTLLNDLKPTQQQEENRRNYYISLEVYLNGAPLKIVINAIFKYRTVHCTFIFLKSSRKKDLATTTEGRSLDWKVYLNSKEDTFPEVSWRDAFIKATTNIKLCTVVCSGASRKYLGSRIREIALD